jgi:membrane protease YdiL (CAAX protease family)
MKIFSNPFIKKASTILAVFSFSMFWVFLISMALGKFIAGVNPFTGQIYFTTLGAFFFSVIFAPLWEELAFRHAPYLIAKKLNESLKVNFTWPIMILSSVIFGWGHGLGPISLLIQGVAGLALSYAYLKNNYSYWSSVIVHALWNFSIDFVFPSFSSTYGIHTNFHF